MLEVQNVTKRYRGIPAVENVSFTIQAGEILGDLGQTGLVNPPQSKWSRV